jgi:hypothetical protein
MVATSDDFQGSVLTLETPTKTSEDFSFFRAIGGGGQRVFEVRGNGETEMAGERKRDRKIKVLGPPGSRRVMRAHEHMIKLISYTSLQADSSTLAQDIRQGNRGAHGVALSLRRRARAKRRADS